MNTRKSLLLPFGCIIFAFCLTCCTTSSEHSAEKNSPYKTWSSYLGDPGRSHYSTLAQFTKANIKDLKVAWTYRSDDWGQMQMNPLVVDSILYGVTAALRVVALHAETGKELWQFGDSVKVWHSTSRGVSYWEKGDDKRILCTRGSDLFALNALTGEPIESFGDHGKVDLRSGLPETAKNKFVISNTPGTVYKDIIVMPLRLSEGPGAPPGDIMAFNIISGAVEWVFHTLPEKDEEGYDTWSNAPRESTIVGAANNWAGMAVDEEAGILFVPTGSAAPDFYGGNRLGSNLYANCLLALDAATGKRIWHFQFVHHDIWDRDAPAPPNLLTVTRDGKKIPAVAQVTKQGYVYLFDRRTGEPLFDIEEVPVPASTIDGEEAWPTQPLPVKPKPFARQSKDLTEADISTFAENRDELRARYTSSNKLQYAPPALTPHLLLPGYDGAAEWGGAAADPEAGILYVNANEMAWNLQLEPQKEIAEDTPMGQAAYQKYCMTCHQVDRKGLEASGFPSLIDIQLRKEKNEVKEIIVNGKGMMTGFPQIEEKEMEALLRFLYEEEIRHNVAEQAENGTLETTERPRFKHTGYHKFLDSKGLPGISPPWGTMHAIDLNTGEYIWSVPLGDTPQLGAEGKGTGCENYGGPIVSENGLLFIAATKDGYFRIFDRHTGEVLWEYRLPAPSFATPAMYAVNGTQYIALACGGEKLGTEKGNTILAFALPSP